MRKHRERGTYFQNLNDVLERVFEECVRLEWTTHRLAKEAGVCHRTIYNFIFAETKYPRFRTVFLLAQAVGLDVVLTKRRSIRRAA